MKTIKIILWIFGSVIMILCTLFWYLFIFRERVTNPNFIKIVAINKDSLEIVSNESIKYIESVKTEERVDTLLLTVYTTTIYNPFAKKTPSIKIVMPKNISKIVLKKKKSN